MPVTVTSREANQQFSRLLERVRQGEEIIVTKHGRPAMRMVPVTSGDEAEDLARRQSALARVFRTMDAHPFDFGGRRLTNDDFYD